MVLRNARRVHCALRGRELVAGVHPQVHLETSTTALLLSFHILNQTSNFNSNFKSNLKWNFKSNFEWNIKPQNVCTTSANKSSTQNCNIALSWYWAQDTASSSPDFDKANSLEKAQPQMKMTWKENFFLNSKTFLDALGSAWLQKSIFEEDHFWLERQFDPASDERNDSRISCYVKESVGDNPADGRNIKTSTESNIQVWLKRKSHGLLLT